MRHAFYSYLAVTTAKTATLKLFVCMPSLPHIIICQARQKKLAKNLLDTPDMVYIERLPATPRLLLDQYPEVALKVFSRENPPVASPLDAAAVGMWRNRIKMRNKPAPAMPGSKGLMEPAGTQGPCISMHACRLVSS